MARQTKAQKAAAAIESTVSLEREYPTDQTYQLTETTTYSPIESSGDGSVGIAYGQDGSVTNFGTDLSGAARTTAAFDMSNLPLNFKVTVPDFSSVFSITDYGNPESFGAAGLKRVTNGKRAADKIAYQEYNNYAENVGDGLKVANTWMNAAIQAAKLGQAAVKYSTAREAINTEQWNYKAQGVKTQQAEESYNSQVIKLNYAKQVNIVDGALYATKLASLRETLKEERFNLQQRQAEIAALMGGTDS